ncbi:MAG TPA: hypothetical protein VK155_00850 [Bacteroidales bacterium]|jgi:hypothetical protein|nr:hypothetical protein [Bacteroidales bacterium]
MVKQKDDTELALRSLFFLLLFLLLALVASTDHGNFHPASAKSTVLSHVNSDISGHDAIPGTMVSCVAAQKYFVTDLKNRGLFSFSVRHKVSDYNRKLARDLIYNHIIAFSIKPFFGDLYLNLPHNRNNIPDVA